METPTDPKKYNKIAGEIISAANQSIPVIRGNGKKSVPWWSEECTVAIRERNKAFRFLKRLITQDTVVEYQKKGAAARRVIKNAKRKAWQEFYGANIMTKQFEFELCKFELLTSVI